MKSLYIVILTLFVISALPAMAQDLPDMVPVGAEDEEQAPAPATGQSAPSDPLFVESIEVRVIELDVHVTDKDGNPVSGLTRDDFELTLDGQETAITNFYAVEGGQVTWGGEEPPAETEAPAPLPKKQPLNLVIYIDNFNIHPFNRKKVLSALKNFLRVELEPDDRVMMVTYNRSLIIDSTFTTDHQRIISTINDIDEQGGDRVFYEQDRRDLLNEIADASAPGGMLRRIERYAESITNELRFSLDALNELVGFLSGIEGRKALIYVSDGLPMRAGEEMFYALEERFERSGAMLRSMSFSAARRFEELTMLANANQVTMYTIDAAGQRNISGGGSPQDRDRAFSSHIDTVTADNMQASLKFISGDTGGVAITNTNNIAGGLQRIATDFKSYYSLGFRPGHAGDGQFHRTMVKVKRDGLKVRQRKGYRDQTASRQMEEGTISSLVLGYQNNILDFEIRTGEHQPYEDGHYLVPVEVRIPIGKLTLLNRSGSHQGRVLVTVAARKDNGDISPVQEHVLPITIPEADWDRAKLQIFTYEMNLVMAPGFQRMAVGVKDELSAEISYVARTIKVGKEE